MALPTPLTPSFFEKAHKCFFIRRYALLGGAISGWRCSWSSEVILFQPLNPYIDHSSSTHQMAPRPMPNTQPYRIDNRMSYYLPSAIILFSCIVAPQIGRNTFRSAQNTTQSNYCTKAEHPATCQYPISTSKSSCNKYLSPVKIIRPFFTYLSNRIIYCAYSSIYCACCNNMPKFPAIIFSVDWVIVAVGKEILIPVGFVGGRSYHGDGIRIDKPSPDRVIVPAAEVVQARLEVS